METVAEGVETKDELALVKELGADSLQGLIFSPAIPNETLLERLDSGRLVYDPNGPPRYRAERRTEFRRVGLIHGDRSEERRVGNECVRTCRSRGSPDH